MHVRKLYPVEGSRSRYLEGKSRETNIQVDGQILRRREYSQQDTINPREELESQICMKLFIYIK